MDLTPVYLSGWGNFAEVAAFIVAHGAATFVVAAVVAVVAASCVFPRYR